MKRWLPAICVLLFVQSVFAEAERPPVNVFPMTPEEQNEWVLNAIQEDEEKGQLSEDELQQMGLFDASFSLPLVHKEVWDIGHEGTTLYLSDGSIWVVHPSDTSIVKRWSCYSRDFYAEPVYLTQNSDFTRILFARSYEHRIVNQKTKESVRVQISLAPYYDSCYYITYINKDKQIVELNNGIRWKISSYDAAISKKWEPSDFVILGVNTRWNALTKPYILMNISRGTTGRGETR